MLKVRARESQASVQRRVRRIGLFFGIPGGAAALLVALSFPSSCSGPLMEEITVNVLADTIAPMVEDLFNGLVNLVFMPETSEARTRAMTQIGRQFAEEMARRHPYLCDRKESEQACINRIAPIATEEFQVIRAHWDQSVEACRRELNEHPNPQSDEMQATQDFFTCMKAKGYEQQIETLQAAAGVRAT